MYPETKENPPHRAVIELATQLRMVDIFGHRSAMPQTNTTDNLRAANGQPTGGRNVKYLEGLRGLAALWVVLDHIFRFTLVGTQMRWRFLAPFARIAAVAAIATPARSVGIAIDTPA